MTTDRRARLSPEQLVLKRATREAVRDAGGQEFLSVQLGKAQSRFSDYGSPNTQDFMPLQDVFAVEHLGHGKPGHPHITHALATLHGFVLVPRPEGLDDQGSLARSVILIQRELGDLAECVPDSLDDSDLMAADIEAAQRELLQVEEATAALRVRLDRLRPPPGPDKGGKIHRIREA